MGVTEPFTCILLQGKVICGIFVYTASTNKDDVILTGNGAHVCLRIYVKVFQYVQ